MNDWISAMEASNLARAAGRTEGDLVEWARLGKLKARAQKWILSTDEHWEERENFRKEPPSDEIERATLGTWPDIFADFWDAPPTKALWGPGTFASRIEYWDDHNQRNAYECITLLGVTFHKDELDALLNGRQPKAATVQPQKGRWQQQRGTEQQRAVFEFLEECRKHPPKGWPLGPIARHQKYVEWTERKKTEALKRTAFDNWAKRHADGWRVAGSKWEYTG